MTKNREIFRQAALDNISSSKQIDQSVTVIKSSTILALISVISYRGLNEA